MSDIQPNDIVVFEKLAEPWPKVWDVAVGSIMIITEVQEQMLYGHWLLQDFSDIEKRRSEACPRHPKYFRKIGQVA